MDGESGQRAPEGSVMSAPVIEVSHFRMAFGAQTVISDLSFDVRAGETFGLLGSNGSGKTTIIRALLDIYQPTAGTLTINGRRFDPRHGSRLGYLPEERGLYRKESTIDVMTYFGRLKGLSKAAAATWSRGYLERVGLAQRASTRLDKLSGGEQQKVQLGVTIMNDPDILILDEPTKGFDPVNRRLLMDMIEAQRRKGATIVFITHQMDEVERLCDRVLLLKDGDAEAYGTIPEVQDRYGGKRLRVDFNGDLPDLSPHRTLVRDTNHAEFEITGDDDPTDILRRLLDAGVRLAKVDLARISLDEIFLRVYGAEAMKEI